MITPQPETVFPQENPPAERSFGKRGVFVISIIIVLILLAGAIFYIYSGRSEKISSQSPAEDGSLFKSNIENIRFTIPQGWALASSSNLVLPPGFSDPFFVLQKMGSSCLIVGADRQKNSGLTKQISFGDRVFSNYSQFDSNWLLASTSDSAKYSFSGHDRQPLPGEFLVSSGSRNGPFVLFTSDKTVVPDDCQSNFNDLLRTIEPYYEKVSLGASSRGILATGKVWDDITEASSSKTYAHFTFVSDGSREKKEVMKIPTSAWMSRFFVSGGKIYAPVNLYKFTGLEKPSDFDSSIQVFDPFSGQTAIIPGSEKTGSYISSIYLQGDRIYYLTKDSSLAQCLDGYRSCSSDLYSIPLSGGTPTLVARSSQGGIILGYIEKERAFYIEQGWGDGPCSSISISKIVGGKEVSVVKSGGCYGEEPSDKKAQGEIDAIMAKTKDLKSSSSGVLIDKGILSPAGSDFKGDDVFYFEK